MFDAFIGWFLGLFPSHRALLAKVRELEALALTDVLTGLPNRRAFDDELPHEWAQAVRSDGQLFMVVCDIDHFKKINDTHGHAAGDAMLRQMGNILRAVTRASDFVARIGGEEFVLLLSSTDLPGAQQFVERLRRKVEDELNVHVGKKKVRATTSFGIAEMHIGEEPEQCLGRADQALYIAKLAGRNRIALAEPASVETRH